MTYSIEYAEKHGLQDYWHIANTTETRLTIKNLEEYFEYDFILRIYQNKQQLTFRRKAFTLPQSGKLAIRNMMIFNIRCIDCG